MSPSLRLVGGAALAGLMIAIALLTLRAERAPSMPPPLREPGTSPDPLGAELARCATAPSPDAACEAVWDIHRRRFLGEDIVLESFTSPAHTADEPAR